MFILMGSYQGRKEEVDQAETKEEIEGLLHEYKMAFGSDWSFWIVDTSEQRPWGTGYMIDPNWDRGRNQ